MNHQSPLDVPELLESILSYFYDDPAYHIKRQPCLVSRLWFRIGHPFLWRSVTLPAVLKLLDDDAWFLYKPAQYKEDAQTAALTGDYVQSAKECKPAQPLTLVLRRPITPPEWKSIMRYTQHVNSLKTVGTYFYPGDQVGVHGSAYEVLARSIPSDFPVFPNLEELYVTCFGDTPEALALFGGSKLRILNFEDDIQNTDAAVCITAFLERHAPLQHIILENVMNVWGALDLTNALPECEALQSLEIHWLVPTLWPGIGALPELKRLLVSAEKPALGMFPEPATTMTTLPFRALTTLKIRSGLPFDDFRRILQTRPLSAPWELECLAFLGPISLGGSVPSHTLYDLVRTHVSAATLKRLALNVVEEPTTDDPFFSIEPIFGFRGLTRLCLLSRFLNEFYYPPLTAEQVKQLAKAFPDMQNMYVDVLFPLTQLLSLALACPNLVRLRLTGYMEESWYRYEEPTLKPPADYYHGLRALNLGGDAADPAVVRYYTTVFRRARTDWSITDDAILEEGYWKDE
ncbi:uncharacterized protein SCHCODRAFT_02691561 [Schizophyllum commune H4-8]|uniref:F-box domain-containing protein n=1 Tax=Schizophyllum commune (strain H4-8 / FGSC 9210) TaxID=578458 RepID=D8QEW2_SCHCM|nr:uncharacterized protein SCHCODRAFT_02691561 [Schizophyllum commune H4-8]KAI5888111.1 hypothetical protein SCHCODRAFT_02691561 [Schizophyllum commune H4-8]